MTEASGGGTTVSPEVKRVVARLGDLRRDIQVEAPGGLVVRQGRPLRVKGRITNTSDVAWPVVIAGQRALRIGAEFCAGPDREKVAVARGEITADVLRPGDYVDFELSLSTLRAPIGTAELMVDLVYEGVQWFHSRGGPKPTGEVIVQPPMAFASIDPNVPVSAPAFWQQHVPEYSPSTAIGIRSPRFQEYVIPTASGETRVKSMLTMDELALLYALARHHYRGEGKIADLGPLLGIGTHVMARGVSQSDRVSNKGQCIYSYDLFLEENMMHFLPDSERSGTGSVFSRYLELNREYLDVVVPVPGDFLKMRWTGEPVEILFIDLAKSWALNHHVLQEFFPCLIPGHSIVLQQDYVHVGEPWVALSMEVLDEYFERLYLIYGCTAVYRCVKPVPQEILDRDLQSLPLSEVDRLYERAQAKAQPSVREVLKCCQAAIRIEKGDMDGARTLIESIDTNVTDPHVIPAQEFSRAISANLNAVSRWYRQALRAGRRGAPLVSG